MLKSQPRIKMLASVTNVDEALIALDAGVDMIDLKNPSTGALGALDPALVKDIVDAVNHRTTVSATIGDLPMQPSLIVDATKIMVETGVDILKIGFFGQLNHAICLDALKFQAIQTKLIAVLLADEQPDFGLLKNIAEAGFYGVMLDTANKSKGHLLSHLPLSRLMEFVSSASLLGLETGLAGSVNVGHIKDLCDVKPSYLGFRGALCEKNQRALGLDATKVRSIKKMLH